jgi:transposase InsO family protein
MTTAVGTKRNHALRLGIARSTLYYHRKQAKKDWELKCGIEAVLRRREARSYGHRRIATALNLPDERRVLRVMKKYGIKPYRRRGRRWRKPKEKTVEYPNLLMAVVPSYAHHVWVADFTHVAWKGRDVIVATVMDVYTRRIIGVAVATNHGLATVAQAAMNALLVNPRPAIFHSDNGSEYNARSFRLLFESIGTAISRSKPGCPWENGYQESFYNQFKVDLGDPNRFATLGELAVEIHHTIYRYNTLRIHSAFGMSPMQFARTRAGATLLSTV